ncbi:nuclear transport factor 2 family protein [Streptosporangium lutulentum]
MTILADPDDRALLLDRDRSFFDALVAADLSCLDDLLADDFVMVAIDNGATVTRADLLGLMSSGTVRFPAVQSFPDEAVVRRIGDVGIVVGRTGMNFTGADGAVFTAAAGTPTSSSPTPSRDGASSPRRARRSSPARDAPLAGARRTPRLQTESGQDGGGRSGTGRPGTRSRSAAGSPCHRDDGGNPEPLDPAGHRQESRARCGHGGAG